MSDLQYLALAPLSEAFPAGQDPKGSPEYDALLEGIAKLNSVQGMTIQDWQTIAKHAAEVLQKQAKDIPAAAYLAIALAETNGLEGWADGVSILADLLEHWWEEGFPPLKRLRARANAVDWWHERSKTFLEKPQQAIAGGSLAALLENLHRLDEAIGSRLPDCSALYDLRELLRAIPLLPEPAGAPGAAAPESTSQEARPELAQPELAQPGGDSAQEPAGAPARHTAQAADSGTTPATVPSAGSASTGSAPASGQNAEPDTSPVLPTPAPSTGTDSGDPEEQARALLLQAARRCYDVSFWTKCPASPLPFRALYLLLWGNVRHLPPDENGTTRLPAPDTTLIQAIQTQLAAGKGENAARSIVLQMPSSPFCLDLHRLLHTALTQAGTRFETAALVVEQEVQVFMARLPGVENLRFTDETPFADEATHVWLHRGDAPTCTSSPFDELKNRIAPLVAGKRIAEALERLREARTTQDGTLQLRIRLEEMRLLREQGNTEAALALADDVEKTLDARHLETWDPALCEEALRTLCAIHAGNDTPEGKAKTRALLARLAVLAPSALLGMPWPEKA